jgi:hypothetical protein
MMACRHGPGSAATDDFWRKADWPALAMSACYEAMTVEESPPSIFDGEPLPDFIDPLVERVEARVNGPVVKVENIPAGQNSEDPVMRFHVDEHLLNRVTDRNSNLPQDVHRIPPLEK